MLLYIGMEAVNVGSGPISAVTVTPTMTNAADLTQVLSGLQSSGELNTVLQQQPHLVDGMS